MNFSVTETAAFLHYSHQVVFLFFQVFVHVSTAYSNCHLSRIEERLHEKPIEPNTLEEMVNNMDDELLSALVPK